MTRNIDDLENLFSEPDDISSILDAVDDAVRDIPSSKEPEPLVIFHDEPDTPLHNLDELVAAPIIPLTPGQHLARVAMSFCVTLAAILLIWKLS